MASKKYASVEHKNCVACGTCMIVCPKEAIQVNHGCIAQVNSDVCVGCGKCAKVCPTGCILLKERGKGK